jgi:hypothetical protein
MYLFPFVLVKLNVGLLWLKLHSTRRTLFTSNLDLELRKKLVKCYIWSTALYGAETWTLREVDQKQMEVLKCGAGEGWKRSFGLIM